MGLETRMYLPTSAPAALRMLQPMGSADEQVSGGRGFPIAVTERHSAKQPDSSAHVAATAVVADSDVSWVYRRRAVKAQALDVTARDAPGSERSYSVHGPGQEDPHMRSAELLARTTVDTAQQGIDEP